VLLVLGMALRRIGNTSPSVRFSILNARVSAQRLGYAYRRARAWPARSASQWRRSSAAGLGALFGWHNAAFCRRGRRPRSFSPALFQSPSFSRGEGESVWKAEHGFSQDVRVLVARPSFCAFYISRSTPPAGRMQSFSDTA